MQHETLIRVNNKYRGGGGGGAMPRTPWHARLLVDGPPAQASRRWASAPLTNTDPFVESRSQNQQSPP
jgi:hypothetical protein